MPAVRPGGKFAHEGIQVPGSWGYATPFSVQAGNSVDIRISNDEEVTVKVCRLVSVRTQSQDVEVQRAVLAPNPQPIYPSSYAAVENNITSTFTKGFTIEAWVRPFQDYSSQMSGIVTQFAECEADQKRSECGFGIFLVQNYVHIYLGDGGAYDDEKLFSYQDQLDVQQWYHIIAVWNPAATSQVMVSVTPASASKTKFQTWQAPNITKIKGGDTYLRLGAAASIVGNSEFSSNFASVDIAMPAIYNRALNTDEILERFLAKGRLAPDFEDIATCLEACWKLDEEAGNYIADCSKNQRSGTIINRGTWRIGGPCADAAVLVPNRDSLQFGHGLRFQQDELIDCMWSVSLTYPVPTNAPPGIYAAKIYNKSGLMLYSVFFNVRRKRAVLIKPADIAVLCSSNTWFAYSSAFNSAQFRIPNYSFYGYHHSGATGYTRSYNVPLFRDTLLNYEPGYFSHIKVERYAHEWMRLNSYDFDSLTDWDLSTNPNLLVGHKVLVIAGHSEYWTKEAFIAVKRFLDNGGKVIGMTGNTMYWRVSFDDDDVVLEGRKLSGIPVAGRFSIGNAESVHQNDGQVAGLAGMCGMQSEEVLGVTSCGWNISGLNWQMMNRTEMYPPQYAKDYDDEVAQILNGVSATVFGVADNETGGTIGCVGHEGDVPLNYLYQSPLTYPQRPPAIIARSDTSSLNVVTVEYSSTAVEGVGNMKYGSAVTYWKRPSGGTVFHFGAIGAAYGLYYDKDMQKMTTNLLQLWGIKPLSVELDSAQFHLNLMFLLQTLLSLVPLLLYLIHPSTTLLLTCNALQGHWVFKLAHSLYKHTSESKHLGSTQTSLIHAFLIKLLVFYLASFGWGSVAAVKAHLVSALMHAAFSFLWHAALIVITGILLFSTPKHKSLLVIACWSLLVIVSVVHCTVQVASILSIIHHVNAVLMALFAGVSAALSIHVTNSVHSLEL